MRCGATFTTRIVNVAAQCFDTFTIQCMWDADHDQEYHYGQGPDGEFGVFQTVEERDRFDCYECDEPIDMDLDIFVTEPCHDPDHDGKCHSFHLLCYPADKFNAAWAAGRR